jgi:RHS repeat-associated protein
MCVGSLFYRRTSLARANGTVTRYSYDNAGRVSKLVQDLGGTANDLTLDFGYNPADQIVSNTRSNDAFAFTGHSFGTTGSSANGLNQLTDLGGAAIGYDRKGNVISAGGTSYGYDLSNRLWSINGNFAFYYDAMGRLEDNAVAGLLHGYDGADLVAEYADRGNRFARRYVHGPGDDEPLVWYEGPGTSDRRFLHTDERGSIVAVTDNAGTSIGINKYDEYGVPASTNIGRFQYTGQTWIPELGMYNYKARIYNPRLGGRFMQPDPIGYGAGMNMYAYVGGDPVNGWDPSGLCENGTHLFHNRMVFDRSGVLKSNTVTPLGFFCFDTPKLPDLNAGDVNGQRPPVQQIAQPYAGKSFCPNPTVGSANRFNPFGRINSGKMGGFDTALADVDQVARVNGLKPLGDVMVNAFSTAVMTQFLIPSPLGDGWWVRKNYWSGDTIISNSDLGFRYNAETGKINIDIPGGFYLPTGGRLAQNETCHYRR